MAMQRIMHDIYPFISAQANLAQVAVGQQVLVTGASSGIGKAIAKEFALAGAQNVIITGRTAATLQSAAREIEAFAPSCRISTVTSDTSSAKAVDALFAKMSRPPDVVVNNAGIAGSKTMIAEGDPFDWWRDWEVNLKGTYLITRAYLRRLKTCPQGPSGVLLNVSSSQSDVVTPLLSSYGTSKAAVNRLTEAIHAEYGSDRGFRCVAFHPGSILTPGMGASAPEHLQKRLIDTVELAGGTALYLSTPRASYLNGRFVFANWDMERLEAMQETILRDDLLVSRLRLGDQLGSETPGLAR